MIWFRRPEPDHQLEQWSTSMTAWVNASGASCGRLCPTPPSIVRCAIRPRELRGVGAWLRMGRAVGIALESDGGHGDHRSFREPLLEVEVSRLALGDPEPPAIVVSHDRDVIWVVEGRRGALERRVVEVPLRRRGPPDELGELSAVLVIAGPAALGGEVILVPPLKLGLGRQVGPCRPPGCRSGSRSPTPSR